MLYYLFIIFIRGIFNYSLKEEDLRKEYLINYEKYIKEIEIELQNREINKDEMKDISISLNNKAKNLFLNLSLLIF